MKLGRTTKMHVYTKGCVQGCNFNVYNYLYLIGYKILKQRYFIPYKV
jgi:hypothetical protein